MGVTALSSTQLTALAATPKVLVKTPVWKGKARREAFECLQVGVGDVGSTFELVKLPAGRVRVYLPTSFVSSSAMSSSWTISIGNRAYTGIDGVAVVESATSIKAAYSTASAANTALTGTAGAAPYVDFVSKSGVTLYAIVAGDTIPDGATLKGFIDYQTD